MARQADSKSLRQLIRFHLLSVGIFASAAEVVESLSQDKNNEYIELGAVQVQIAQARRDVLESLGITLPGGRGRLSLEERAEIEAKLKKPAFGNKLRGMRSSLASKYRKLNVVDKPKAKKPRKESVPVETVETEAVAAV